MDDSKPTRWDTEARAICVKLIPHTTSVHNARIVADAIAAARADERERCAQIVDRHPDEAHPAAFDAEDVRGCCEAMADRIRSGEP